MPTLDEKWKTTKLNDYIDKKISLEGIGIKILNKIFINYTLWAKNGFGIFYNKINPYIKNINECINFKISSKSKLIKGVFLGLGINGGLKIKNKNDIIEYFSIDNFSFPKDDIK